MPQTEVIASLLQEEIAAVQRFVILLRSEQQLLQLGDAEQLSQVNSDRSRLIERLTEVSATRNACLEKAGFGADAAGLAAWANDIGEKAEKLRSQLLALAKEARDLGQLNAQLIALRMNHTEAALSALVSSPRESKLYGRDGHSRANTGYRIIDLA